MTNPASIIVAHASVGSGHRIAAEAVARELTVLGEDSVCVDVVDVLEGARIGAEGLVAASLSGRGAGMYDPVWSATLLGRALRAIGGPMLSWGLSAFESHLLTTRPAAVVCTHAWPAVLAARLVRTERLRTKVICVSTDFGAHALWPIRGASLFCAADTDSAEEASGRGMEAEIAVTGIPVRVQFTVEYERSASREHFGLPTERRLLLAIAGASAPAPYKHLKPALEVALPALASLPDTAVAIVTGRDAAYADALRSRASGFGTTNVSVLGFVEHMAPLMACADIGIAKPGGLVCAECLSTGLPLITVGPTAGQERVNARALTAAGAAVHAENPRLLAEYVRKVASKPARLARMREAAASLARPFAATDIARRALSLAGVELATEE